MPSAAALPRPPGFRDLLGLSLLDLLLDAGQGGDEKDRARQERTARPTGAAGDPNQPQANNRVAWCANRRGSARDLAYDSGIPDLRWGGFDVASRSATDTGRE